MVYVNGSKPIICPHCFMRVTDKMPVDEVINDLPCPECGVIMFPLQHCDGCGNPEPTGLVVCPYCAHTKCEDCDMGNDVECPNCPDEDEDFDVKRGILDHRHGYFNHGRGAQC